MNKEKKIALALAGAVIIYIGHSFTSSKIVGAPKFNQLKKEIEAIVAKPSPSRNELSQAEKNLQEIAQDPRRTSDVANLSMKLGKKVLEFLNRESTGLRAPGADKIDGNLNSGTRIIWYLTGNERDKKSRSVASTLGGAISQLAQALGEPPLPSMRDIADSAANNPNQVFDFRGLVRRIITQLAAGGGVPQAQLDAANERAKYYQWAAEYLANGLSQMINAGEIIPAGTNVPLGQQDKSDMSEYLGEYQDQAGTPRPLPAGATAIRIQ